MIRHIHNGGELSTNEVQVCRPRQVMFATHPDGGYLLTVNLECAHGVSAWVAFQDPLDVAYLVGVAQKVARSGWLEHYAQAEEIVAGMFAEEARLCAERGETMPDATTFAARPGVLPEDIARFTYHPIEGDQASRYRAIRTFGLEFATMLRDVCPPGDLLDRAIDEIDDAVMHANAAVARCRPSAETAEATREAVGRFAGEVPLDTDAAL